MNKKVMDALEAIADQRIVWEDDHNENVPEGYTFVKKDDLDVLMSWALGQRIHLQFGEEVGLKVYKEEEEGFDENDKQPSKGTIVGFDGRNGVLVEVDDHERPLYYDREDIHTL